MPVLTGNNGTVYIAEYKQDGALALNSNFALSSTVLAGSTAISAATRVEAVAVTGNGTGAIGELYSTFSSGAWSGDITASASARSGNIKITSGGKNYSAGDIINWRIASNDQVITSNVSILGTITSGIDTPAELRVTSQKIARVRSWSLDITNDVIETTVLGNTSRTYTPSASTATGTATLMYYRDDGETDSDQLDIGDLRSLIFNNRGSTEVLLSLGVNTATSNDFVFRAFITGASLAVTYGEVVSVDVNFQVNGAFIDFPAL